MTRVYLTLSFEKEEDPVDLRTRPLPDTVSAKLANNTGAIASLVNVLVFSTLLTPARSEANNSFPDLIIAPYIDLVAILGPGSLCVIFK